MDLPLKKKAKEKRQWITKVHLLLTIEINATVEIKQVTGRMSLLINWGEECIINKWFCFFSSI